MQSLYKLGQRNHPEKSKQVIKQIKKGKYSTNVAIYLQ